MTAVLVLLALVVVVAGLTVGSVRTLRRQQDRFRAANEVVPGVATSAPAAWAGSHDPEARLHRRLRDAMTALHAGPTALDGSAVELRVEIEQQALALDEALVAIAAAPAAHRDGPRARVTQGVEVIERAVVEVAGAAADEAVSRLEVAAADVRQDRVDLAAIRAELDRPPHLPALDGTAAPADSAEGSGAVPAAETDPPEPRPGP